MKKIELLIYWTFTVQIKFKLGCEQQNTHKQEMLRKSSATNYAMFIFIFGAHDLTLNRECKCYFKRNGNASTCKCLRILLKIA